MRKHPFKILLFFLGLAFLNQLSADEIEEKSCRLINPQSTLLARGEHRIQVQRFGRKDPDIPISIMQANFYNEHHEDYVIKIEDLNDTINREIQEEAARQYNEWFEAEFNERILDYHDAFHAEDEQYQEALYEEQPVDRSYEEPINEVREQP